jgi:hypothetical protein
MIRVSCPHPATTTCSAMRTSTCQQRSGCTSPSSLRPMITMNGAPGTSPDWLSSRAGGCMPLCCHSPDSLSVLILLLLLLLRCDTAYLFLPLLWNHSVLFSFYSVSCPHLLISTNFFYLIRTLLVSINEATKLPDGTRCPAFALVVRDKGKDFRDIEKERLKGKEKESRSDGDEDQGGV